MLQPFCQVPRDKFFEGQLRHPGLKPSLENCEGKEQRVETKIVGGSRDGSQMLTGGLCLIVFF